MKTIGTPFTNENEMLAKKTVTIKLELDGKEYIEEYECDGLALFMSNGERFTGNLKCTGRLVHDAVYTLLKDHSEISQLAVAQLIKDDV